MKTYHVMWEIDLDAESPEEAAKMALLIQRDSKSSATVFDVIEHDGHETVRLDLEAMDGARVSGRV